MERIMRFSVPDSDALTFHLKKSGQDESFAYVLCSMAKTLEMILFICRQVLLPDNCELANQSPVSIEPERRYQATAYGLAYDQGLSVVDVHTHPFTHQARFSGIDDHHGERNAQYIASNFPEPSTMGMVVFGAGFDNFEAQIWNRENECFEPVDRIEILGSPTTILTHDRHLPDARDDIYARHKIIPGWKQGLLEKLKVSVCGLGGNGSLIFESLLALGVGRTGWIKATDPDILEASNLPRIPYAYPHDVGRPKAHVALRYARKKAPDLNVSCFTEDLEGERMQSEIKEADLIIGAVDNDGARTILIEYAARYMIPYLDVATEIIPDESSFEAVGQVQVFSPGQTGCMICSGAIDPSRAALDSMSDTEQSEYESVGYVRGTSETPTPSVLHLNGVVSHLAVSQLLRFLFADGFTGKEYLHYNRQTASMMAASVSQDDECPVCGIHGILGAGDTEFSAELESLADLQQSSESTEEHPENKGDDHGNSLQPIR